MMTRYYVFLSHLMILVHGCTEFNENMKSFSYASKASYAHGGKETLLYEHNSGSPGVLTEQWFTGANVMGKDTIVRYYIDGDTIPTIETNLYMMHGIGWYNAKLPAWGTKWIGHVAQNGGLYNKFRFPFQHSIRVVIISPVDGYYWFIIRGVENYPVVIGDLKLPSNARLVLHKIEDKTFSPLAYVPLVVTNNPGLVFLVAFRGESVNFYWLEGCFGAVNWVNGNRTNPNLLSSGTEDFFLSAYYFNKGMYQTDDSGVTYIEKPIKMSAYKFFHSDPVIMSGKFALLWRVGEKNGSGRCWADGEESSDENFESFHAEKGFSGAPNLSPTKITSYVWTYEW